MEPYADLGRYRRDVTANNADAKLWFNRGLIWCYAFAFEEAARCFARALKCDPDCNMAHWGTALAIGPYYNKQWERFDPLDLASIVSRTHEHSQAALKGIDQLSGVEQALIRALTKRFQAPTPAPDLNKWNDDYADAMRGVYRSFPNDADVCALFADALMNRTPWGLWDIHTGKPCKGADTKEALEVVETKMAAMETGGEDPHPGLLHFHIHILEMSPFPEKALRSADRLRTLVPDAGHLNHMPTHIDVQCGLYINAVVCNDAAIEADSKLVDREGLENFHALSRAHNFHFKIHGAMLLGQSKAAMAASKGLVATIPEALLRWKSPPMADWLEGYVAMYIHPFIRFGHWQEILSQPFPNDRELYCSTTALLHYARTLAHAVLGDVEAGTAEFERFQGAVQNVPETRTVFNNTVRDILGVAREMAQGELTYRMNAFDSAFEHLRRAVALSDALPYDEPWGWMQPARHALGALLLEQGELEEAEAVYRADLGLDPSVPRCCHHPENVWALHGFHESLLRQGKLGEARLIEPRLKIALARCDVPIQASCLCRLDCHEQTAPVGTFGD